MIGGTCLICDCWVPVCDSLMCNWFVMSLTVSISVVGFVFDGSDV